MVHVLFVCTGNVCRSPIAERLAISIAHQKGASDFRFSSAGTLAVISHPMHPKAATILEELGGDSTGFAARQLTTKIADEADLILAMTRAQREAVLELAPRKLRQTFTLREAALLAEFGPAKVGELAARRTRLPLNEDLDIADPIGRDAEFFSQVGSQIAALLPGVLECVVRSDSFPLS